MSIQDDVFDVLDELKGKPLHPAMERIEARLWLYEESHDALLKFVNSVDDMESSIEKIKEVYRKNVCS